MLRYSVAWGIALLSLPGCSSESPAPPRSEQHTESIVGGTWDTTTKAVVALTDNYDGTHLGFCSGSLLAPNLVLTARHCVSELINEVDGGVDCDVTRFGQFFAWNGMSVSIEDDITDGANPSLLYGVSSLHVPTGNLICSADVALLILDGQGIPDNLATPLVPRLGSTAPTDMQFSAVGYGITSPDDVNGLTYGRRMRFDDAIVYCSGADCGGYLEPREWLAEAPTCSGDSGGPAIDQQDQVSGVISRGDDVCSIAIYADVSSHADLIRTTAWQAATEGDYTPPTWAGEEPDPEPMDAGSKPDAGMGMPDAGSGDAGSEPEPDAGMQPPMPGTSDAGNGGPSIDALGISCNGDCPGSYACYAENGAPPGVCVPYCGQGLRVCPSGYECSSRLHACTPAQGDSGGSEGCSFSRGAPQSAAGSLWLSALLAAVGLCVRRRRR